MPPTFFDSAYFLQAIGWAVVNSIWQAGVLYLIYLAITAGDKKLSALVKYHLSLAFLFFSFTWFVFTAVQNYQLLLWAGDTFTRNWVVKFALLNKVLPFVAVFYFTILVIYIIRFFQHYFKLRLISTSNLLKAPVDIKIFTNQTAIHLGIKKKVKVWLSELVDVPSITGFFKPVILLPAAIINNLTVDQVNAILLHELAHIKRNDYLLNFLQSILVMLLYFNPFVVLLSKAVKKERENCCDDWVLNYQFNQIEYAKALLVLEEQRHQQIQLALAATNNKKILLHRIKRLLNNHTPKTSTSFAQKFNLIGFCLVIFVLVFIQIPPLINKNSSKNKNSTDITKKLSITNQAVFVNLANSQENSAKMIPDQALSQLESKKTVANKIYLAKKTAAPKAEKPYLLALINEDELPNKNTQPTLPTSISNNEGDSLFSVFVKVEEEQSGKKQLNTYYFRLKDDKGKTDITPLLIIKKYNPGSQKNNFKKLPASKLSNRKKRIST